MNLTTNSDHNRFGLAGRTSVLLISGVTLAGSLLLPTGPVEAHPLSTGMPGLVSVAMSQDDATNSRVVRKVRKRAEKAGDSAEQAEELSDGAEDAYERAAAAASQVKSGEANSMSDQLARLVERVIEAKQSAEQAMREAEQAAEEAMESALAAQEALERLMSGDESISLGDVRRLKRQSEKAKKRAASAQKMADNKADMAERLAEKHARLTREYMADLQSDLDEEPSDEEERDVIMSGDDPLDDRVIVGGDSDDDDEDDGDSGFDDRGSKDNKNSDSEGIDETLGPYDELSGTLDTGGWTDLSPPEDARIIYVSASLGSDANSGMSEGDAVRTLARGMELLRDNQPDQLLLKRGDVWEETFGALSRGGDGPLSGRSTSERMVFGAYGEGPRPMLKIGSNDGISPWSDSSEASSHIAVVGIHFYAHTRDPYSPEFKGIAGGNGFNSISTGEDILIEDCRFDYCDVVVSPYQRGNDKPDFHDFKLRRSVVYGNYSSGGHAQGTFINDTHGILLEENVFDHNGWNEHVGAERTKFNHNAYVTSYASGLVARGNIFARGSSSGLQARHGGIVEDNLFVKNAAQLNWGYLAGIPKPTPGGVTGRVKRNIFMDARAVDPDGGGGEDATWGMKVGNVKSGEISHNLVVRSGGIEMDGGTQDGRVGVNNLTVRRNRITDDECALRLYYTDFDDVTIDENLFGCPGNSVRDRDGALKYIDWGDNDEEMQDLLYTIGHYHALFGGGESLEAYLKEARKQGRHRWDPKYVGTVAARWLLTRNHSEMD